MFSVGLGESSLFLLTVYAQCAEDICSSELLRITEVEQSLKMWQLMPVPRYLTLSFRAQMFLIVIVLFFALQYFEVPYDSQMNRTKNRVLVRGQIR